MPGAFYNQRAVSASNPAFSEVKCNRCHVVKNVNAFAKNRLPDLQAAASRKSGFNARNVGVITCMQCSPQQVTELLCHMCDETKALDKFPKTQRRTPDTAMCWVCKEERANFEPGAEDSDVSGGSDSDSDSEDSDEFRLDTVIEDTASMSLTSGVATYSSRSTGGVQVDGSTQVNDTTRASSTVGTSVTASGSRGLPAGFNRNGYGVPARKAPASVANSDSKKFAKVKAVNRNRTVYDVAEQERQMKGVNEDENDLQVESSGSD